MKPAYLFHNRGKGQFEESACSSGAAFAAGGRFMAGMGIAAGDIDGTGRPSLLVSNYQNDPTVVFLNRGRLTFQETSHQSGIGPATVNSLSFGIDFLDADLDGTLDVAVANGHVVRNAPILYKAPYEQPAQFFLGDGPGHFREVSDQAGEFFREKRVGRGLAVADYNNDGRADFAVSHNAGPVKLLRNATPPATTGSGWNW